VRALVVVDLGFGDSGKGLLTDYLVRTTGAPLVVRYNGGAQAGHNVVTPDGRHHTFAQFGAGSFVEGVRTVLSRHVVVHPTALLHEAAALEGKGIRDPFSRVRISEHARVITPFHQAANRLREMARGRGRHGSCGVGVGDAVEDAAAHPEEAVVAGDLRDATRLAARAGRVRGRRWAEIEPLVAGLSPTKRLQQERRAFEDPGVLERWVADAARVGRLGVVVSDEDIRKALKASPTVVFEGAQGALLDEVHGFHPFTTWSCCTAKNALELIRETTPGARVERIGVLRSHAVRHGPGPLPSEAKALGAAVDEHNRDGEWQGPVRYGWFDAVLARYALEVVGGVDALAITHADVPRRLGVWKVSSGYRLPRPPAPGLVSGGCEGDVVQRLGFDPGTGAGRQMQMTDLLLGAAPLLEECAPDERAAIASIERLLGRPVDIVSGGPTASDVTRAGR
jgi:adenylosuccinate synthase